MESYEVNSDTLAIIPINANETRIIEKDSDFIVNEMKKKMNLFLKL